MIIKNSAFEIPIYKTNLVNHKEIKHKFTEEILPRLQNLPGPNNIGLNLYSDYFPGLDRLDSKWKNFYSQLSSQFLKKAGFNQNKEWTVDIDLWYNVGFKGSFQEEHDHMGGFPGCQYSAIHFLIYDPREHEPTRFYNPIHHTFLRNMHPCNGEDMPIDWQTPHYVPQIQEGDVLIFPSYLKHSVPYQKSDKLRATIALNFTIGNTSEFLFKNTVS